MIDHRAAGWGMQLYCWRINTVVAPPTSYSTDFGPKGWGERPTWPLISDSWPTPEFLSERQRVFPAPFQSLATSLCAMTMLNKYVVSAEPLYLL